MTIRVVEIVAIQRQLSRVIQVVRAAAITRQLLHPRLHQLQHLHRHQLLYLSQSQSRMYGIVLGRVQQITITQLVEAVMFILLIFMQVCVMHVGAKMFQLATLRLVLDSRFGY